jgi:hypothetical protein
MSNTTTQPTETIKAVRSKSSWEKLGVKFVQTECMEWSFSGGLSEPHMAWRALYKKIIVADGGRSLDQMLAWMSKREDKIMDKINLWKQSTK